MTKNGYSKIFIIFGLAFAFGVFFAVIPARVFADELPADVIKQKQAEIAALEKQIAEYNAAIAQVIKTGKNIQKEIAAIEAKVKKSQAQIKVLQLAIEKLGLEIKKTESEIKTTEKILSSKREVLGVVVRNLYQKERTPLLDILANNDSFFDFFNEINVIDSAREEVRKTVSDIEATKKELEVKKTTLDEQYEDQAATKKGLEIAKVVLEETKIQKNTSLQRTKAEEKNYKELLTLSKANLDKLKNEIFYMLKAGITAEDALKYGQAVANTIGLRPAFLLAILEIESRLGASVGTGYYKKDMNPNQWDYFLDLTAKLGLNPETTPVSKKPSYGWGGAMGPAQFLPGTWLGWESKIAKITGHNPPSPWSIEDSFTAAALKLYNDGASAKTRAGELRAAKAYISGNPNCTKSICNYYANLAMDKSDDIEETLKNK